MLRSATDLEDYTAEVVPAGGTMLAFRRTENSFHGHKPHVGERRILQLSYTKGGDAARFVQRPHQAGPTAAGQELSGFVRSHCSA